MNTENVLQNLAPCGLACFTCAAAKHGVIRQHSQRLLHYLDGFDQFAARMAALDPRLKQYPAFKEALQMLGEARCEGCRDGVCKFPGCEIAPCVKQQDVDFCFECDSFPCDKADFEPLLKAKWLEANARMKEVGPEAYLEEVQGRSHYA